MTLEVGTKYLREVQSALSIPETFQRLRLLETLHLGYLEYLNTLPDRDEEAIGITEQHLQSVQMLLEVELLHADDPANTH